MNNKQQTKLKTMVLGGKNDTQNDEKTVNLDSGKYKKLLELREKYKQLTDKNKRECFLTTLEDITDLLENKSKSSSRPLQSAYCSVNTKINFLYGYLLDFMTLKNVDFVLKIIERLALSEHLYLVI